MANISLNIPDAVLDRVLDSFALIYQYNPNTDGSKGSFAKKQVIEFIKRTVKQYENRIQFDALDQTIKNDVDANIIIS